MILALRSATRRLNGLVFLHGGSHRRSGAFFERVEGIDRQIFKALDQAAGPADLTESILAAEPRPKWTRMSLLEM